jgi:predicted transcriptional regulator
MKNLKINQFDEKDEEIVDALISLGMSRSAARMLAYVQQMKEATSVELEIGAGLRQPEVSIASKQLTESDWINEREEKKPGKGRPFKVYSLKVEFKDILAQLEAQQSKKADEGQAKIKRLRELGKK